jgi:hypothetical protein
MAPIRQLLRTARSRRLLRDVRRNADWVSQARTTPTLQNWTTDNNNSPAWNLTPSATCEAGQRHGRP